MHALYRFYFKNLISLKWIILQVYLCRKLDCVLDQQPKVLHPDCNLNRKLFKQKICSHLYYPKHTCSWIFLECAVSPLKTSASSVRVVDLWKRCGTWEPQNSLSHESSSRPCTGHPQDHRWYLQFDHGEGKYLAGCLDMPRFRLRIATPGTTRGCSFPIASYEWQCCGSSHKSTEGFFFL